MEQFLSTAILLFSANAIFIPAAQAECHHGSDGNQYCGDVCALNSDGSWSCYNYSNPDPRPSERPIECHLGSNGNQYCGQECALNSDGTWGCD